VTAGIALLGSGLATELHTRTLRAIAPAVRRYYASRDATRAAGLAATHKGAGYFGSYDAALASPDVTAVIVGLPPSAHLEWTVRALAAGKHVIVEKPPFLRAADCDAVETAARHADRQVLVAENYFYKPLTGLLRQIVRRGDLGAIRLVQLNAMKHQPTANWRDDPALAGGGALFEGGIHWISLLANIGLTPRRVHASLAGPLPDRTSVTTLDYEEGAVATLTHSWDLAGLINGVRFSAMFGTAGSARFESNGLAVVVTGRRPRIYVRGLRDLAGYRGMMTDFLQSIRTNRPPAYDLALARRDLSLVEAAYATAL
jgi:predicted dehydrogenase